MTELALGTDARPPSSASTCDTVKQSGEALLAVDQRHPRFLEDRGAAAGRSRRVAFDAARPRRGRASGCWPRAPTRRGSSWPATSQPDVPDVARRRPGTPAAGPHQPRRQRHQVHRTRRGRRRRRARGAGPARQAALQFAVSRHRHRHPARQAMADLRAVRAGRRVDHAPVRRHRAGAGDLVAAGRADGRTRSGSRARSARGSRFHFVARFGLPSRPRRGDRPASRHDLDGLRVLVVDDNATNRRILEEMLTNWRMSPASVDSAAAALSTLSEAAQTRPIHFASS